MCKLQQVPTHVCLPQQLDMTLLSSPALALSATRLKAERSDERLGLSMHLLLLLLRLHVSYLQLQARHLLLMRLSTLLAAGLQGLQMRRE